MIRYAVTSGQPDTGRRCTVVAREDGEIVAYYVGWFDVRRRIWRLYMDLNPSRRNLPSTMHLRETDVHYEVSQALLPRKKNIQKKVNERDVPRLGAKQIKLI